MKVGFREAGAWGGGEFVRCSKDGLGKIAPECSALGLLPAQAAAQRNTPWGRAQY